MNHSADVFENQLKAYQAFMHKNNFVISLNEHGNEIVKFVTDVTSGSTHNILKE